ncbi:hypothetical protein [Serratia marcescens]|uniref:hypothetical protein n=1 Tax=Serratia marcescens TaxID=615 RepID=UPI000F7E2906|nr:hypothetical protein [Serratia marcescens]NGH10035.1 hypothetical protein [Serratia marcescens]UTL85629.1 hypothetical protein NLX77_22400 [Serratia marcescens]UYY67225.1 hypothetical protein OKB57_22450 [Serratia marcescens]
MGMVNVAFWSNVALTLALMLLVMAGIWNTCQAARKNRVIMKYGKETRALIVNATPHKRQVIVGKVSVQLQLAFSVKGEGYHVLKDVIVSPYYVDALRVGNRLVIRYREGHPRSIVIMQYVDN